MNCEHFFLVGLCGAIAGKQRLMLVVSSTMEDNSAPVWSAYDAFAAANTMTQC